VVHWHYVAIVRPTISFASLVWWPGCQTATAKKKLSKVQRLASLGITGAIRTTPTGAMEVLVGLPPLDLVIRGGGEVGGTPPLEFGVLVLPSHSTRTQLHTDLTSEDNHTFQP